MEEPSMLNNLKRNEAKQKREKPKISQGSEFHVIKQANPLGTSDRMEHVDGNYV